MAMQDNFTDLRKACVDREICGRLLDRLKCALDGAPMRFMEVCGTHTVALFQSGLRSMLPDNVIHLSGPGCPVCVTHESEVAQFLELAGRENVIIATFGDLLRVPGPEGQSLKEASAAGALVNVIYTPLDALALAERNPEKEVVFPGIGFETTAPTVAAVIQAAEQRKLRNFSVLSFHKLVPPVLSALLSEKDNNIDAFLLPGHVAMVTGLAPFSFLPGHFHKPAAVGGFEPADLLLALISLADQIKKNEPMVDNAYPRAVPGSGNARALAVMNQVFTSCAALWRGLGRIEGSGLSIREEYAFFDARRKLGVRESVAPAPVGCQCGEILKGRKSPQHCPLFGKNCTPATPVGPCMVSTEGSCAAHFKYGIH